MQKTILNLLGAVAALLLSTTVYAVGMGAINVTSALGQPLKADIGLLAVSKAEKSSLVARLAAPEAYKSAGLEFPFGNKFKFQIETRANGEPYLVVSSTQPINDPFVTILVELTWAAGKLLREYTFLLDPVGYVADQPAQAAVQAVAPEVQVAQPVVAHPIVLGTSAETAAAQKAPEVTVATLPESDQPAEPVATPTPSVAARTVAVQPITGSISTESIALPANKEWLTVKRGDTMTQIAAQYKPADISLERMLVALYRANVNTFDSKNMNRIQTGKILQLPTQAQIDSVAQLDAKKEIRAQAADWNSYRQKLASAAPLGRQTQPAQQVASGKISSSVADQAPVAKASAQEVLKLSKGEAPGDQVAAGAENKATGGKAVAQQDKTPLSVQAQKQAAQEQKNAAQEEAIASAKAAKEEQLRTAMLAKNLQDMQRLAEMKAEAAALAAASKVAVVSPIVAAMPVKAAPLVAASAVVATSAVVAVANSKPFEIQSLLDLILGEPLYLAAVALLALVGVGLLLRRRKKKYSFNNADGQSVDDGEADSGHISGRMSAPVAPSPDTGDFTRQPARQDGDRAEAASQSDNVDPISEADLFLSFGRDAQAEEILKEALKNTPTQHQIHLKLLGIYANRNDLNSFSTIARTLQASGDEQAWQEALAMGRALEPNNPLYGGSGSHEQAQENTGAARAMAAGTPVKPPSGLDFDFDMGALTGTAPPSPEQNFLDELDSQNLSQNLSQNFSGEGSSAATMDFDVTGSSPAIPDASQPSAPNLDELIFDVSSSQPTLSAAKVEAGKAAPAEIDVMEFTLDFPVSDRAVKSTSVAHVAETSFSDISLNLDDAAASDSGSFEGKDDHWQEVATKLDLAKAYQEMGDADGVREILAEVLNEGDADQQEAAKNMLKQLG